MNGASAKRLLARFEAALRAEFNQVITRMRLAAPIARLESLLAAGRLPEALRLVEGAADRLGSRWLTAFITAGESEATFLQRRFPTVLFDVTTTRAAEIMRANRLRIIRAFVLEQTESARLAVLEAASRGLSTREMAIAFQNSLGLAATQERMIQNYRRLLERGDPDALRRELRDRRFDRAILAARDEGLTTAQINRMVDRYREKMLRLRADTIAATEARRALHEASAEMLQQARDQDLIPADQELVWNTIPDNRRRDSHVTMHGQRQPLGQPFISGAGIALRWPGDVRAPAAETVNCRCFLTAAEN